GVEALDREEGPGGPDLDEVFLRLTASRVAPGEAANEGHVALDEPVAGAFVPLPVGLDQGDEIDVLRHGDAPPRRATLIPSSIQAPSPPSAGTSCTVSTSRATTRRTAASSSCPRRKAPTRTVSSDSLAVASTRATSPTTPCMRRLSTPSRRSSTRSTGSSKRAATPPSTSVATPRYPSRAGNST